MFEETIAAQDKPPIALAPRLFSRTQNAVQESHLIALGRAHLFSRMVSVDLHVLPEQTDNPVAAMVHHQEPTLDQTKQHAPVRVQILTLDQIANHRSIATQSL